jgi:hypothetical protein
MIFCVGAFRGSADDATRTRFMSSVFVRAWRGGGVGGTYAAAVSTPPARMLVGEPFTAPPSAPFSLACAGARSAVTSLAASPLAIAPLRFSVLMTVLQDGSLGPIRRRALPCDRSG